MNVVGYLDSELGMGEAARQLIAALDAQRIPLAPTSRPLPTTRSAHPFEYDPAPHHGPFAVNVICENAIGMPGLAEQLGADFFSGRYTIGMWFWEVSTFPDCWSSSFGYVDEVWVASDHVAEALRARSPVPVTKITLPVVPTGLVKRDRGRLGMPTGFCFLFVFDYNSTVERKNPLGVIEAFRRSFPASSGVSLLLKTINAERHPADSATVQLAAAEHPCIQVMDRFVAPETKNAMIASCDCYVSLHRSEGFGLTLAEAMYFDKPVIATGYSGNLDFMTAENSYLVSHEMRQIGPGAGPYPPEGEWADPNIDHAAELMRHVHDRFEEARDRGRHAGRYIRETRSAEATGRMLEKHIERAVAQGPRAGIQAEVAPGPVGSAPALSALRESLCAPDERPAHRGVAHRLVRRLFGRLGKSDATRRRELDQAILEALEEAHARDTQASADIERVLEVGRLQGQTERAATLAALRRLERRLEGEPYPPSEEPEGSTIEPSA